jgi:hypothetical protein
MKIPFSFLFNPPSQFFSIIIILEAKTLQKLCDLRSSEISNVVGLSHRLN